MFLYIYEDMKEIWRDIRDYEGLYQVSNYGRVKSLEKIVYASDGRIFHFEEKIRRPQKTRNYLQVILFKNGEHKAKYVHVLVAEAFLGPRSDGYDIDHIDHNPQNCRLDNLRYLPIKENRGKDKGKKVLQCTLDNEFVKEWSSIADVERETGYSNKNINKCCLHKRKTAYGFIWRYL